jgi:hypothetical protein
MYHPLTKQGIQARVLLGGRSPMAGRINQVLLQNPRLLEELYLTASEIVDDFEDYGPVLQANENSIYDENTVIRKLQAVRNELIRLASGAKG